MMIQKISILGCGWLGLPLGTFLAKKGYTILGSTTRKEKFPDLEQANIQPFQIALPHNFEEKEVESFLQSDLLILNIPPGRRHPKVEEHHFQQIEILIRFLKKSTIQKVIFISSTGVYGNENRVMTEQDATNPTRASGKALIKVENYLKGQTHFETTILRLSGLVGGNRKAGRFLAGKKEVKNGNAPINMVHRNDCIAVIFEVLKQKKWGEIFNVCADKHPTRKEFYISQTQKEGLEAPTFLEGEEVKFKIISNEKLKKELGYSFMYPNPMEL